MAGRFCTASCMSGPNTRPEPPSGPPAGPLIGTRLEETGRSPTSSKHNKCHAESTTWPPAQGPPAAVAVAGSPCLNTGHSTVGSLTLWRPKPQLPSQRKTTHRFLTNSGKCLNVVCRLTPTSEKMVCCYDINFQLPQGLSTVLPRWAGRAWGRARPVGGCLVSGLCCCLLSLFWAPAESSSFCSRS